MFSQSKTTEMLYHGQSKRHNIILYNSLGCREKKDEYNNNKADLSGLIRENAIVRAELT